MVEPNWAWIIYHREVEGLWLAPVRWKRVCLPCWDVSHPCQRIQLVCVCVSKRKKNSRIFLMMEMSWQDIPRLQWPNPPKRLGVSFLPRWVSLGWGFSPGKTPPRPAGSRDTLVVEEESLILQQVGDANEAETGPRETTKFGGAKQNISKELPKVAARPTKKNVYFEDSYVKCTVWCESDDLFASDYFFSTWSALGSLGILVGSDWTTGTPGSWGQLCLGLAICKLDTLLRFRGRGLRR